MKIKEVYEQISTKEKAGLYSSIVLGDKSSLDGDIKKLYQRNGIAHLLAISGLHISLVGMALYRLLRRAGTSYVFSLRQERFYNRICSDDRKYAVRTAGIGDVSFDDVCTGARKNI